MEEKEIALGAALNLLEQAVQVMKLTREYVGIRAWPVFDEWNYDDWVRKSVVLISLYAKAVREKEAAESDEEPVAVMDVGDEDEDPRVD